MYSLNPLSSARPKRSWLKRMATFGCVAALAATSLNAQFVIIGTDAASTAGSASDPIDDFFNFARYQVVYTAAELSGAGMPGGAQISGLGFSVIEDNGPAFPTYTIRMAHTTATNSASHNAAALTTVFGPASYDAVTTVAGSHDMITFSSNFTWNGTDNILVDICTGSSSMPYATPYGGVRGATLTNGSRRIRCDACGSQCAVNTNTTNTVRPQIRFNYAVLGCTQPTGTASQTVDCGTTSYTVSGTLATMGDATSVDVVSSVHGTIATLAAPGAWGPTPSSAIGVNQTITLVHNLDPLCNANLGSFSGAGVLCNDACATPYALPSCTGGTQIVDGTTTGSTVDAEYSNCGAGGSNTTERGVWYTYAGDDNQVTITTCATTALTTYDTRLTVYEGSCGAFTCVAGNDDMSPACPGASFRSSVTFNAFSGTTYYVFVHGFQSGVGLSATGNFRLTLNCSPLCLPIPGNDLCAGATAITVDAPAISGSNTCAAATIGNPTCESGFATLPDVYYSFVASAGGTNLVTITQNSATNMGYALYDACGGTQVACVATVTSGSPNTHTGLTGSNTYYLRVETDAGSEGTFDIQVTQPCQPAGTRTAVAACATQEFYIDVNVTDLGTSTDLDITTDFVGDTEPTGVGLGVTQIGPYPSGTSVVVTLVHDNGGICNLALSSVSLTCPPVNDDCANAIALTCNSVTTGSTTGSAIDAVGTCTTALNTAGGVWYTFVGNGGTATLALCGSTYDTQMGVFTTPDCTTFTCVEGNDDDNGTNGANVCSNNLHSSLSFLTTNGTTYHVLVTGFNTNTGNFTLELTCTGNDVPPCADNGVVVDLTTDNFGSETSWAIYPVGNSIPVCSGSGYNNNSDISIDCCLMDGCYILSFFDDFGDGMCCTNGVGGYKLSTSNGKRIIDNVDDGEFTSVSSVANGFCVPIGATQLTIATCDKEDFLINDVVVSGIDPAVSAQFGVTNATSGYQFWLFDPDGSYSRRLFRSHASGTCVGTPAGATRAAHMKFSCLNSVLPNVPTDLLLNMRVRPRVAGVYGEFGPACRVMVLSAPPACPTTQLDNNVLNAATTYSCGATGKVVGASGYAGKLYPNIVAGANKYQYEFVQVGEAYARTIATATGSYALTLANWATNPLLCGTYTYDVRVRVSFDGGTNWCAYGPVCTVEITNNPPNNCTPVGAFQGGGLNAMSATEEGISMWPNPTGDGRVTIELNGLSADALTANVEIFDLFGKRVATQAISTDGATEMNTVMTLDNLATGMYMVHVTSGNKQFTDRLVIK